VLRDTVRGKQPTQWQFWTLTKGIAPEGKPSPAHGKGNLPFTSLPGDRFTAQGQFGVDVDSFVASPQAGSAFTLRYGTEGEAYGIKKFSEYQDALVLRLPGDGDYFVILAPRLADSEPVRFGRSEDGHVITLKTGSDISAFFLSAENTSASWDGTTFRGTAGVFRKSGSDFYLALGSEGEVSGLGESLIASGPLAFSGSGNNARLETPASWPGGSVRLANHWKRQNATGAEGGELTLPAGAQTIELTKTTNY